MIDLLLPLLVVVPIVAATVPLALGLRYENVGWPIAAGTTLGLVGLATAVAVEVYTGGGFNHELGGFAPPVGIELVADELSAAVLVLIAIVSVLTLAFSRVAGPRGNAFYSGYLLLTGGLMGVALTGDLFNMFVFLEIVGLTTYALIAADRSGASAYASVKYLVLGTVGASLYLVGVGYVFLATGTLNMLDLQSSIAAVGYTDPLIQAGYAFIVAGFALKIALFPVHTWQPDAYQRAPDAVTAFVAALVSTAGAYALIRVTYTVFTVDFLAANEAITAGVLVVAGVSILAGSVLAAMQSDLKRIFAYSSVAQFGMIAAAVALANETALLGGIVHLIGHGLLKFGLFLAAGLLALGYGARRVEDLASLARRAPYTAGSLAVLGLALVGIPPSIGFLGKWYIAFGAVQESGAGGGVAGIAIAGVVFVSTLFTLVYVARLIEQLYFAGVGLPEAGHGGDGHGHDDHGHDSDRHGDAVAADGGHDAVAADEPVAPKPDAPDPTGIPDRVPTAAFLVLVGTTVAAVALGFAGIVFAELFDPFLTEVFA
ncbi:proton-conducting transporter membrane subunit [Halorubrum sp. DTA98]|uniref:proton-conducting transporter transmembrane domain-containing protein n=1 Tax=Halorubrum sp. DTA98 TaxID=3402163 RepID=UPI003AABE19A